MKKFIKVISLISLISFGAIFSSCNKNENVTQSDSNFNLETNYVSLSKGDSYRIKVSSSLDVSFKLTNEEVVRIESSLNNECLIYALSNGVSKLKVYETNDETNYKYVFINVSENNLESTYLEIKNINDIKFYCGVPIDLSNIEVNLVNLYKDDTTQRYILNNDEYIFSLNDKDIFYNESSVELKVSLIDSTSNIESSYNIEVIKDVNKRIEYLFSRIKKTNNYTLSFTGLYNNIQELSGDIYFTNEYYLNTYTDMCFAKDNLGVFKFNIVTNTDINKEEIETTNGYFNSDPDSLYDVVSTFTTTTGIKDYNESIFDNLTILDNDTLRIEDSSFLSLVWNKTLGFNGSASKIDLSISSYSLNSVTFFIEGKLSSGYTISFYGTIKDIEDTYYSLIEEYLHSSAYTVNKLIDDNIKSIIDKVKNNSFSFSISNTQKALINEEYIAIINTSTSNGYGIINLDDGVYNFILSNDTFSLGSKYTSLNDIKESLYYLPKYSFFKEENLYKIYDVSSYYGAYVSFDKEITDEFKDLFSSYSEYESLGIGIEEDEDKIYLNYYFYKSSLTYTYLELFDIGSSNLEVVDNYLNL